MNLVQWICLSFSQIVLDSDDPLFGGFNRLNHTAEYFASVCDFSKLICHVAWAWTCKHAIVSSFFGFLVHMFLYYMDVLSQLWCLPQNHVLHAITSCFFLLIHLFLHSCGCDLMVMTPK